MDEKNLSTEISEHDRTEKFRQFRKKFFSDLKSKENWKLKAIYFFILTGLCIIWVQFSVHISSLHLSNRDIADFSSVGSVLRMLIPFLAGVLADKIGNFTCLLSGLMIFLGINIFIFSLIPKITMIPMPCDSNDTLTFILNNDWSPYQIENSNQQIEFTANQITYCISNHSATLQENNFDTKELFGINCSFVIESTYQYIINTTTSTEYCNQMTKEINSYKFVYWSYMATRTSFAILTSASFIIFEGAVMVMDKERNVDYGLQRAWGTLAALGSSYAGGEIVDIYSKGNEEKDYTLIFVISGISCILAGIIASTVNMNFKLPTARISAKLLTHVFKFEIMTLLIIVLLKGLLMGYAETFMYLYMNSLGASAALIGFTVTVGAIFEIFLQLLATPIIKIFGQTAVIAIGILFIAIRFTGFSYTHDPRVIVGLETLDSWSSGFCSTAINMYCSSLASAEVLTSLRGIIGAIHDGVGKLISVNIGIEIQESFGERNAWRIMAIIALLSAVGYASVMYFGYAVKRFKNRRAAYSLNKNNNDIKSGLENKGLQI